MADTKYVGKTTRSKPDPTEEDIRKGLEGNLCMCTGYMQIVEAVKEAAKKLK